MNIFDVADSIERKSRLIEENEDDIAMDSKIDMYMVNRVLSQKKRNLPALSKFQMFSNVLDKIEYFKLLKLVIPFEKDNHRQRWIRRTRYFKCRKCGKIYPIKTKEIKKTCCKSKLSEVPDLRILKFIAKFFGVSTRQAKAYRPILEKENTLIEIVTKFGEEAIDVVSILEV